MPLPCSVSENTVAIEQNGFWNSSGSQWDAHKIGWAVAGGCTIVVRLFCYLDVKLSFLTSCSIYRRYWSHQSPSYNTAGAFALKGIEMFKILHIVVPSRNYTNPNQQRQMLALVSEPPICFGWRCFPIVYAFYTCLQSMPSSHSSHIVFSEFTPITHWFKLVCLFKHT